MSFDPDILGRLIGGVVLLCIFIAVLGGILSLVHFLLTLPMRRAERARLFLDLIESAIKQGCPVEETLISISQTRDLSMGVRFHLLAAWLEQNVPVGEALAKVPRFLPPQITAMLMAGRKIGDVRKVLPACRQLLKDAVSQTRGAINYLVILTFVITPLGMWVIGVLKVVVLPKFREIFEGTLGSGMGAMPGGVEFILDHAGTWIAAPSRCAAFVVAGGAYLHGRAARRGMVSRFGAGPLLDAVAAQAPATRFLHHAGHSAGFRCS